MHSGNIVIPHAVMKFITLFYQTMSDYADNFAIVDEKTPHIKVLVESPSENIGESNGSVTLTIVYGRTLYEIYRKVSQSMSHTEGCEEREDLNSLANITQLSNEVLIRRTRFNFMINDETTSTMTELSQQSTDV